MGEARSTLPRCAEWSEALITEGKGSCVGGRHVLSLLIGIQTYFFELLPLIIKSNSFIYKAIYK